MLSVISTTGFFRKYSGGIYLKIALGLIWLVQISGMIGISMGYLDWFITKTPGNLSLLLLLTVIFYPINDFKKSIHLIVFLSGGIIAEVIGVNTGLLFGDYQYGENLGPKIAGVPLLIGVNWALLILTTGEMSKLASKNIVVRAALGSLLMVILDFFIEPLAPVFDFWSWEGGDPPLYNYICWFIVAFLLQLLFHKNNIKGKLSFSIHFYFSQLLFFIFLHFVLIL